MEEINFIRGDSLTIAFPITNKSGDTISLNNIQELYLTCRTTPSKSSKVIFQKDINNFRFEDNKYKVDLLPDDTQELDFSGNNKSFFFDIEVTLLNGLRKSHIYSANIRKDYTIHESESDVSGN